MSALARIQQRALALAVAIEEAGANPALADLSLKVSALLNQVEDLMRQETTQHTAGGTR